MARFAPVFLFGAALLTWFGVLGGLCRVVQECPPHSVAERILKPIILLVGIGGVFALQLLAHVL